MPRKAIDYNNTIIYKIQHEDDDELVYVGHTTDFTKRKYAHKNYCNNPNNSKHNYKIYKIIRDNGGWSSFRMIEIKKYPCSDANEACTEEDRIMREMKATMNSQRAYTGLNTQQYHIQYYIDNADNKKKKQRQYKIDNRDKIRENNRERITCNCGCVVNKSSLLIHNKTKKHLERLEGLEG